MCKFCEREYDNTKDEWFEYDYGYRRNQTELASGCWTALYIGINSDNRIVMRACGDDYTEDYYPKYCPECGRKLREGNNT